MAPQNVVTPEEMMSQDVVWIFGYGSLIWHPNFEYAERKFGFVKGFVTRFWQGSIAHRGTPDKPGRVATMVEQKEGQAWGVVFKLEGADQISKAFHHLNMRECLLGCYRVQHVDFHVVGEDHHTHQMGDDIPHMSRVQALAFRATPENDLFIGPETVEGAARVVASSKGLTGHNAEYLFRLVDFMHQKVPHAKDRYLFELERLTRQLLKCACKSRLLHEGMRSLHKKKPAGDQSRYYHKCYLSDPSTVVEQRAS